MKQLLFSLIFLVVLPGMGLGQTAVDTVAVTKQVDSLITVSRGLMDKRDFEKAMDMNAVATKLALEKLGAESGAYGNTCIVKGLILYYQEKYPEAEKWYLEAKAVREKVLGKEHLGYAAVLNNLAALYRNMGNYEKAEPLYLESKDIREKALGKESAEYAWSLNNLANLYGDIGKYENAERYNLEAISIRAKILGKEHLDYANSLNSLATIYLKICNYEKAEPLYLEAKEIREKKLGKENPYYAYSLSNLGALYWTMGDFEKAEPLLIEAMAIQAKTLGKERSEYAWSLINLAILYNDVGNFQKAEQLHLEAKAIREKILGTEHTDYANSLFNLGALYKGARDFKKAEPFYLEAKDIREKALGKEHPDYASCLNNLASIHYEMGRYEEVETLCQEAMAIQEKALGKDHPDYAWSLYNLADLQHKMGNYKEAETLYIESKTLQIKALNKENLHYTDCLAGLAALYKETSRYEKAEPIIEELTNRNQILLTKALHHLSERELNKYLYKFSGTQSAVLSLTQNHLPTTPTAYNNTLFYKGFLLNAYNQIKRFALSDSTTTEKFNLLKSYERRLATQYSKPVTERKDVAELEEKANNLEKDLARSVAGYGEAMQQVKWQEVQQNLKPNESAIEFVHYQFNNKNETDSTMYAALLLRPGWAQPRMIGLFEQRQIQPLLAAANTASTAGQLYATRGMLRGRKTRAGQPKRGDKEEGIVIPGEKTASLYQLVWEPMDSLLSGVKTVYFAPSGLLHRLDLAAMAVPGTDQILADKYDLVQLGSTRQLVVKGQSATNSQTATLFGGIKYDLEKPAETLDSLTQTKPAYDVAALRSSLGGRGGDAWNYLPGTEKEVKNAAKTLGKAGYSVHTLSGSDGSEAAFKMMGKTGLPAPRVLHIATHGFFFPDPKDTTQQRRAFSDREPVFKTSDNPLLRSGLVLAGANPAWAGGKTPEGQEDGILTAYEISQMNLSGTELVVLSACETGLGDVEDNEGVYGLKRSFKIAGAKYLIMSLWQVPDQQTQELMSAFYKNWLEGKMAIPKAFAAAQQTMRKRYEDPFFWAGFILVE